MYAMYTFTLFAITTINYLTHNVVGLMMSDDLGVRVGVTGIHQDHVNILSDFDQRLLQTFAKEDRAVSRSWNGRSGSQDT
jgi:hypothetical protein